LSVAFLYTKLAPRRDHLSLLLAVLLAGIAAYVVFTLMGFGGLDLMILEFIALGVLVPAAVVAALMSSTVSTKSAATMLLLASAIGGFLAPRLLVWFGGGILLQQLLNAVLAVAFVVFLLASILRAKRERELRQGRAP
jgi:hypothetical protein